MTHWSSRLLAERMRRAGSKVSHATVARVWKKFGIQPHRYVPPAEHEAAHYAQPEPSTLATVNN